MRSKEKRRERNTERRSDRQIGSDKMRRKEIKKKVGKERRRSEI